jgi:hypothetical protein
MPKLSTARAWYSPLFIVGAVLLLIAAYAALLWIVAGLGWARTRAAECDDQPNTVAEARGDGDELSDLAGGQSVDAVGTRLRRSRSGRPQRHCRRPSAEPPGRADAERFLSTRRSIRATAIEDVAIRVFGNAISAEPCPAW